jgi:hypothetical protein
MNYQYRNGWHVSILESDCGTALPLKLTFQSEDKVMAMYERFGSGILEERQALDMGLTMGRGSAWLNLNDEQYGKLMDNSVRTRKQEAIE